MVKEVIIKQILDSLPKALAIYAFGSRIHGTHGTDSDLDLAVLVPGYVAPLELWNIANDLANQLNLDIDLLDFRAASTVMQHQILSTGERWWQADDQADQFEAMVFSELNKLDAARGKLLDDIASTGKIHD